MKKGYDYTRAYLDFRMIALICKNIAVTKRLLAGMDKHEDGSMAKLVNMYKRAIHNSHWHHSFWMIYQGRDPAS